METYISSKDRAENLNLLIKAAQALLDSEKDAEICLNILPAMLMFFMDEINWAGFYILKDEELVIGPFQGKLPCLRIPLGKGVCGTAVTAEQTQLVDNVHEFQGHIACDADTNSELVVPILKDGKIFGVIDIDSPKLARFTEKERQCIEEITALLADKLL